MEYIMNLDEIMPLTIYLDYQIFAKLISPPPIMELAIEILRLVAD